MSEQYVFHISDSYTPKTIPMERLAEYMTALARLLGETASVHFDEVFHASTALRAVVDTPAQPKVEERLQAVKTGTAALDVQKAYEVLDEMLRKDNAFGSLVAGDDQLGMVIPFPGKRKAAPSPFGPFRQEGTLDGQVYRIGGKDETKHVAIRDDAREFNLVVNEALALELRHHLFGGHLRFRGTGTWFRHGDGRWELKSFKAVAFEVLDDAPLSELVERLRAVPSELRGLDDAVRKLMNDRSDFGSEH